MMPSDDHEVDGAPTVEALRAESGTLARDIERASQELLAVRSRSARDDAVNAVLGHLGSLGYEPTHRQGVVRLLASELVARNEDGKTTVLFRGIPFVVEDVSATLLKECLPLRLFRGGRADDGSSSLGSRFLNPDDQARAMLGKIKV
jgi:hypothetical protein